MTVADVDEWYELTIHNLKIRNPVIINTTKHEQDNFGELTGDCYGYIVHRYEEDVTEVFTEYFGATGEVETTDSAGVYFTRQQFYNKDGSRYWSEWRVNEPATAKAKTSNQKISTNSVDSQDHLTDLSWKYVIWIFYFLIGLVIWPRIIVTLLVLFAVLLLLYGFSQLTNRVVNFIPWLGAFVFLLLLVIGITALFNPVPVTIKSRHSGYQSLNTRKQPLENNKHDTIFSHSVQWSDYDSNQYRIELSILQSAVHVSQAAHLAMPFSNWSVDRVGSVYAKYYKWTTVA